MSRSQRIVLTIESTYPPRTLTTEGLLQISQQLLGAVERKQTTFGTEQRNRVIEVSITTVENVDSCEES